MGWETRGKPVPEDEAFGEEFVAYVNAYWIDGEVIGGVYGTEEEACASARALILELGMLSGEDKILDGMDGAELEDRINESERVGFAQVAQRDVLFS
jgi:hypothetical protein